MTVLRPRDCDAVRAELRGVAAQTAMPVLFGGEVHGDTLLITELVGTRTVGLRGLAVRSSSGLGGASMVAGRPLSVSDYRNAASITHDYDGPVLSEGIHSVLAVPVVVDGQARAVLYGAHRGSSPIGGRTADVMLASARRLSRELLIRDEVDRRVRLREAALAGTGDEGVRTAYAELRRLAAAAQTPTPEQLLALADQLAGALTPPSASPGRSTLSARELDVLAQVALGCTNAEAAQRLSIKPETVKSYLRSAGAKLGARTRHEAVSKARLAGMLP
ncbi:helix-turn-helix transcriptional regulator [Mycobacterium sp. MS1601]|uniref:helix-turn-helix transcriptional regulator n=1 Tax=Mycobacterium sp. MS1601 TaxID=1936029 RepID=UPI000979541F|nr:helix-turn-helix transcriptional regulator [Mycobacterium sp. MS1601]AQA02279.1 helix-turn-helix transcriptional regulator [Mycobacterium sp. MS1601]